MSKIKRLEEAALLMIVVGVGAGAGYASFSHVHDFTLTNSPAGTPDAFGWINACASELVPIGSLISMRRRARQGKSIRLPLFYLLAATAFSLTAQFAVAQPTVFGWLVGAFPALAFLGLGKLAMSEIGGVKPAPVEPELPPVVEAVERTPEPVSEPEPAEIIPVAPRSTPHVARAPKRREGIQTRRKMHESIALLRQIRDSRPEITPEELMAELGISSVRHLRNIIRNERTAATA